MPDNTLCACHWWPIELCEDQAMTDTKKLKELAERALGFDLKARDDFYREWTPKAACELIAEVEQLESEIDQCASALPGTYYMDPPDGGNVSIPEQIRRMAKDAARYRGLRDEGYLHNWASLHVCDEHLRAQRTDEAIDSVLNIGAKQ
ncbi:hypothetical protein AAGN78_004708 [Pseudomonas aeruginosa]|nr:hypothetical protein [Pseudomonas aeruginosa]